MSERVACVLCERTFGSIEALERHETTAHPPEPHAPQDDYQARMNDETLADRGRRSALRADLEALAETLLRVEALARDVGRVDLAEWARKGRNRVTDLAPKI